MRVWWHARVGVTALLRAMSLAMLLAVSLVAAGWAAHGKHDWPVPEAAKKRKNPVARTDAAIAAARAIYLEQCSQCHGDTGKGDGPEAAMYAVKPPDMTDAKMMDEMTDGEIFYKISEGRQPMPGFKKQLTEEERWQLAHFLRTLVPPAGKKPAKKKQ